MNHALTMTALALLLSLLALAIEYTSDLDRASTAPVLEPAE